MSPLDKLRRKVKNQNEPDPEGFKKKMETFVKKMEPFAPRNLPMFPMLGFFRERARHRADMVDRRLKEYDEHRQLGKVKVEARDRLRTLVDLERMR